MKIKILHILQSLNPGGLENGVINLSNKVNKDQFAMHIYCIREIGEFRNRIKDPRIKVEGGRYKGSLFKECMEISKVCKSMSIDIVHTHGWGTFFVGFMGAKLAGVPVIINGEHGYIYAETYKRRIIQKILFNLVDLNISVCDDLKKRIIKHFRIPEKKISSILNGVDTEKFFPDEDKRLKARNGLGVSDDIFVIGSVGRLVDHKDYPTLIKAISVLRRKCKNHEICCIMIGEGQEKKELESLAEKLGVGSIIRILGHRDDIPELLNAMDIFVLNSTTEGLSNTILEAMACGKPVVATKVGGNIDIIIENSNGLLFPVGDYDTYADRLYYLLENEELRKLFSKNALRIVKKQYSLKKMILNYEKVYENLYRKKSAYSGSDVPRHQE